MKYYFSWERIKEQHGVCVEEGEANAVFCFLSSNDIFLNRNPVYLLEMVLMGLN
jgi:hypothetical protein